MDALRHDVLVREPARSLAVHLTPAHDLLDECPPGGTPQRRGWAGAERDHAGANPQLQDER